MAILNVKPNLYRCPEHFTSLLPYYYLQKLIYLIKVEWFVIVSVNYDIIVSSASNYHLKSCSLFGNPNPGNNFQLNFYMNTIYLWRTISFAIIATNHCSMVASLPLISNLGIRAVIMVWCLIWEKLFICIYVYSSMYSEYSPLINVVGYTTVIHVSHRYWLFWSNWNETILRETGCWNPDSFNNSAIII